jgi:hypothetical protein
MGDRPVTSLVVVVTTTFQLGNSERDLHASAIHFLSLRLHLAEASGVFM